MALSQEQVGLIFRIDADSKPAQDDIKAFKAVVTDAAETLSRPRDSRGRFIKQAGDDAKTSKTDVEKLTDAVDDLDKAAGNVGKKGGDGLAKLGRDSKASAAIIKESVETISSEIIESFGVDGDIANTLGKEISGLSKETLILGGIFVGVTAAAVGLGAALFAISKSTAETLTEIGDLSEKTKINVETLSALRINLQNGNSDLKTFGGAVEELQKKMVEAQSGNKDLAAGFQKLGVDLNGGVEPALAQIVKKYNELPDGAERTAFATNVFGDAGADLVLTLNSLNGSLDGNTAKMRELGLTVTPANVAVAKQFDDQMKSLGQQLEATKISVGNFVIPAFTEMLSSVTTVISALRDLQSTANTVFPDLQGIAILLKGAFSVATGGALASALRPQEPEGPFVSPDELAKIREQASKDGGKPSGNALPFGGGGRGGGRGGAASDPASDARLRQLQIQLQEEERIARSAREAIKRTYDQRAIDEQEFANQQIAAAQDRLAKETAILDQERLVIERSKFSKDKKATELARVDTARTDLERQTADEIGRINDDLRRRLEQAGIAFEQAQAQARDAALRRRAASINAALDQQIISNEEAERQLTEIAQQGIENRLALANAEVDRAGQNTQSKAVALEKVKALEIELAAAVEAAGVRIQAARDRDLANARAYAQQIARINAELRQLQIDELNRRASDLNRLAQGNAAFQAQAIQARAAALAAENEQQRAQRLAQIQQQRDELVRAVGDTSNPENAARVVEIERLVNEQRLAEEQRFQEEKGRIRAEARAAELELQGFDQGTADAIAQQEVFTERTLTLWEQLRVGAQTTAESLAATLPSIGALFVQTGQVIASSLATSIAAFVGGAASVRKAAAEFFKAALAPLKDYLLKKSKIQFAEAIASLAAQDYRGFALHTLAGTALAAAAGLIDAGGSAIAGGGGGAVAPSAGGGTNAQPQQRTIEQGNPIDRSPAQVVLIRAEHAPGVVVELVRQNIADNGVLRDTIRRESGG